jgi:hypothetical protein
LPLYAFQWSQNLFVSWEKVLSFASIISWNLPFLNSKFSVIHIVSDKRSYSFCLVLSFRTTAWDTGMGYWFKFS